MSHRVIAGKAKGRRLKQVPGDSTRPVMDRIKENVFNILGLSVVDTYWLDMFGGTGSIGIEALSRGAVHCTFLELNRKALVTIKQNLETTGFTQQADVHKVDALTYLNQHPRNGFDYIYVAPPQYMDMWRKALRLLDQRPDWVYPDGVVVVQIDPKEYQELELGQLSLYDQRKYGNTMLCFYERPSD